MCEPNHVTENQFLKYSIIDEMTRSDYTLIPEPSTIWDQDIRYETNHIGFAFVSHIIDELGGQCFIIDVALMPKVRGIIDTQLKPIEHVPQPRQMFIYLYQEKFLLRAIRLDEFPPYSDDTFEAQLVDIGCKITIKIEKFKRNAFMLKDESIAIPKFVQKCQVLQIPNGLCMFDLLHARVEYKVLCRYDDLIFIDVLRKDSEEFYKKNAVPDFYSYFRYDLSNMLPQSSSIISKAITEDVKLPVKGDTTQNVAVEKHVIVQQNEEDDQIKEKKMQLAKRLYKPFERLTVEDEENVRSKQTVDHDKEATRSLNHNNQTKSTVEYIKKGAEIMKSVYATNLPAIGEKVIVNVTNAITPCEFYGSLSSKSSIELIDKIASDEFQQRLRLLRTPPKIGDKVFAIYNMGLFRAIIIRIYDKNTCQVYYYDYGNCAKVQISEIYESDTMLEEYPPFALHFRINRTEPCHENDINSIHCLEKILLIAPVQATIVDIVHDSDIGEPILIVDLLDQNDIDVAKTLANKRYVVYKN